MPGTATNKVKLLRLMEILAEQTDEEHPMDATGLIDQLAQYGISAERKSIYRDVETLRSIGMDIILTREGYFLGQRDLQLAEIRLLVDAVLAAGFITPKKSVQLIEKLERMCSRHQAAQLREQVYINHRNKQDNEEIYYSIDMIHRAVAEQKKISVQYGRRVLAENGKVGLSTRSFTVSPYALLWFDDRYYLIGNNEKYDDLMHLRVDRMHRVTMLDQPSRSFEEVSPYRGTFDVADYAAKLANAFGGTPMTVELICRNDLLEPILDRFGGDVSVRRHDADRFWVRVRAAVSDGLVHDLLNFGDGVEVRSPASLREQVAQTVENLARVYGQ